MSPSETSETYVVVALAHAIPRGTGFNRTSWPLHVTVVPNFTTTGSPSRVTESISRQLDTPDPLVVETVGSARFGPQRDIPVLLVESEQIVHLHHSLAGAIRALPGFAADEPTFWGAAYRPHITVKPEFSLSEGQHITLTNIAIARLTEVDATVVASLPPPPR